MPPFWAAFIVFLRRECRFYQRATSSLKEFAGLNAGIL